MMESQQFLQYSIRKRFTNQYGETNFHIMNECFDSYRVAYPVPKNSIYKPMFDRKIKQIIEAGLTNKYFKDEMEKQAKLAAAKVSTAFWNSLQIDNLQAPLMIFPMLMGLSILTFLLEMLKQLFQKSPSPSKKTTNISEMKSQYDNQKWSLFAREISLS